MQTKQIGPIKLAWPSLVIIILNIRKRGLARSWWFSRTEPLSPIDLALHGTSVKDGDEGEVVKTKLFLEERKGILELVNETLQRAQKCYKKQVTKNQRQERFKVGQKVWLNVKNFTLSQGLTPKFMTKFARPFPVIKQVFDGAYKFSRDQSASDIPCLVIERVFRRLGEAGA